MRAGLLPSAAENMDANAIVKMLTQGYGDLKFGLTLKLSETLC